MRTTAVIQARMGSTRLPGKVMLPLDGVPLLEHVVRRARAAESVDDVVVATSFHEPDDMVARYAEAAGASVYRGSEDDVLGRMQAAAVRADADAVARVTADNPFVPPALVNELVETVRDGPASYASNKLDRTFPLGFDAEVFTAESFATVEREARQPHHREHVTPYYHEHPERFDAVNLTVEDVYGEDVFDAGPELRMTLDEPDDYEAYSEVYEALDYDDIVDAAEATRYLQEEGLDSVNESVTQKTGY